MVIAAHQPVGAGGAQPGAQQLRGQAQALGQRRLPDRLPQGLEDPELEAHLQQVQAREVRDHGAEAPEPQGFARRGHPSSRFA